MTGVPDCAVAGDGEVLLFLHGVGGGARCWEPQLAHYSDRYLAAAWDMPGYGNSVLNGRMTFPLLSDALLALFDARGWERAHLVGHSMGGMVAQEFAADHQDRLHSLALSGTSPAFGRPDGEFQKKFVADRLAPLAAGASMEDLARELVRDMMSPDADPDGRAIAYACMAEVSPDAYRAAIECIVGFDRRADLARIRVPALALAGGEDVNAPAAMMEKMAARIPSCRYVCLEGLGHLANLEDPAAFNRELDSFLETATTGVEERSSDEEVYHGKAHP